MSPRKDSSLEEEKKMDSWKKSAADFFGLFRVSENCEKARFGLGLGFYRIKCFTIAIVSSKLYTWPSP